MSNEKEPAKPPAYLTGPGGAQPIPVKSLRCRGGIVMELPAKPACANLSANFYEKGPDGKIRTNQPRYRIDYLPWLGAYCVVFYASSETQPTGEPVLIPREWCQWVPVG